jgi:serine/threonine-protein kinase
MAEVFLAVERGMAGVERKVVLKRILPQHESEEDARGFAAMFADEARVASRLTHPNIAHVYNFGEVNGVLYLTMEYVDGVTVSRFLRRLGDQRLPLAMSLRIISDLCAALHHAHELCDDDDQPLGVVHRDVSPQNIMLSVAGVTKLIDFGIARARTQAHHTASDQLKGKLAYMAPEMFLRDTAREVDRRGDVFACGVVLFELVAGQPLFQRSNEGATMFAVRDEEPPSLVEMGLSPELDAIVRRAVSKDREQRYPSAQAMQDDIEGLILNLGQAVTSYAMGKFVRDVLGARDAMSDGSNSGPVSQVSVISAVSPLSALPRLPASSGPLSGLPDMFDPDDEDDPGTLVVAGGVVPPPEAFREDLAPADAIEKVEPSLSHQAELSPADSAGMPASGVAGLPAGRLLEPQGRGSSSPEAPGRPAQHVEERPATVPDGLAPVDEAGRGGTADGLAPVDEAERGGTAHALQLSQVATSRKLSWLVALGGGGLFVVTVAVSLFFLRSDGTGPTASPTAAAVSITGDPGAPGNLDFLPRKTEGGPTSGLGSGLETIDAGAVAIDGGATASRPSMDDGGSAESVHADGADGGLLPDGAPFTEAAEEPRRRNRLKRGRRRPVSGPPGQLFLDSQPWSRVKLGKRTLGTTPLLNVPLPPGRHLLRLMDAEGNVHRKAVIIRSGRPTKLFVQFP